jgi:hypothetical protein
MKIISGKKHSFIIPILSILLVSTSAGDSRKPWGVASMGVDVNNLTWDHGTTWAWGFQGTFGLRLVEDLYLTAKVTLPIPGYILIGNQVSLGGELSYLFLNPDQGFAVKTAFGASWNQHWPEDIIVILADGPATGDEKVEDFDKANGLRYWATAGLGIKFSPVTLWLDIGPDFRRMDVRRFLDNEIQTDNFDFIGPHFELHTDIYF